MKELKVLNEKALNKETVKRTIIKAFKHVENNIEQLNKLAEQKNIYVKIDEKREKEKILQTLYEFLYLGNQNLSIYGKTDNLINEIVYSYNNRIRNALNSLGFISIKNGVVKVKPSYKYIYLYYLKYVSSLDLKDSDITIIKTYKNGNIDFKFNDVNHLNAFEELVFYSNDKTQFVINKAPDAVIKEYKEKRKNKAYNEYCILHDFIKNKGFEYSKPLNFNLINKCWGC